MKSKNRPRNAASDKIDCGLVARHKQSVRTHRSIIALYSDGWTPAEIAAQLDLPEKAVRVRIAFDIARVA